MTDRHSVEEGRAASSGPRRIGRPPTLDRDAALRAARDVIARRGLARTRYADVAEAAGVPVSTLQHAFGSLGAMLTEALERFTTLESSVLRETTLRADGSAWAGIEVYVRAAIQGMDQPDSWMLWIELWALAGRDADVGARAGSIYAPRWEHLAELIAEGTAAGEFAGPLVADPMVAAQAVVGVVTGVACPLVMRADGPDHARATDVALQGAAAMLGVTPIRRSSLGLGDAPDGEQAGDLTLPERIDAALGALSMTAHAEAENSPIDVDGPASTAESAGLQADSGI